MSTPEFNFFLMINFAKYRSFLKPTQNWELFLSAIHEDLSSGFWPPAKVFFEKKTAVKNASFRFCNFMENSFFNETDQEIQRLKAKIIELTMANLSLSNNVCQRLNRIKSDIDINQSQKSQAPIREQEKISKDLGEFDYKKSNAWKEIEAHNWGNLSKCELLLIARVISAYTHIQIDRESKRRKPVLVKWFDDHLDQIKDCFNLITIQ